MEAVATQGVHKLGITPAVPADSAGTEGGENPAPTSCSPLSPAVHSPYPQRRWYSRAHTAAFMAVCEVVCAHYRISHQELMQPVRDQRLVLARQVAWFLLRKHYSLSFPAIGAMFGKDHTTIIHGCRVAPQKAGADELAALSTRVLSTYPQS